MAESAWALKQAKVIFPLMNPHNKLINEGEYVAEVEVELLHSDEGWAPYLSMEDAGKLDDVRESLRHGDIKTASRLARVYTLTPVTG